MEGREGTRRTGYKKELGKLTKREKEGESDRKRSVPSYKVRSRSRLVGYRQPRGGREGRVLTICTHKQAAQAERKGKHRGKQNVQVGGGGGRRELPKKELD